MSSEILSTDTALNFTNTTSSSTLCTFQTVGSLWDFLELFKNKACYRHSVEYTVFLCVANLLILAFGLVGNSVVIYVVVCKLKTRTESSFYIFNLAVANLFVIFCCIPVTLVANLFMPWVFGKAMCNVVAYGQGASVFCSVYSLVAISFDRFRAIYLSESTTQTDPVKQAAKVVGTIWIFGLMVTLPWAIAFKVVSINPYEYGTSPTTSQLHVELPFCQEIWKTKTPEAVYFLLVHVFACFVVPLGIIIVCNVLIWRSVLSTHSSDGTASPLSSSWCLCETQRRRKLRVLKMFTGLTFAFFICWLPLYVIMARVKLFYTESYRGSRWEQDLVHVLIPAAQLLGSCNSCVNPVLYAMLNQNFRYNFRQIFACSFGLQVKRKVISTVFFSKKDSRAVVVANNIELRNSRV